MKKTLILTTALVGFAAAAHADVTVMSWGGSYGAAQTEGHLKPFTEKTGIATMMVDSENPATPIKAMVEAGNVTVDVASLEYADAIRLCDEGVLEPIDVAALPAGADGTPAAEDFLPGAVTDCGVSTDIWATVFAYDTTKFPEGPTTAADFFDLEKFPGKRGLRKGAKYTLEFALLADGVPASDVYKVLGTKAGVDRAFKKLDQLKPNIQWWEAGAQPPQFLASGDVVMSSAYNGRIDAAQKEGKNLKVVWNGSIYDVDSWAIPKGAKVKEAMKFINFASKPENQKNYSAHIAYGPTNLKTVKQMDAKLVANLPTAPANLKGALALDVPFWVEHGEDLEERFNAWAAR